jgi:hypothetical protein
LLRGTNGGFTSGRYAHRHSRKGRPSHSKDVGVEVVSVNDVDIPLFQEAHKATQLCNGVSVIKAGKGKRGYFADSDLFRVRSQGPGSIEGCQPHAVKTTLMQKTRQLHTLPFRTTLMKTGNQFQNVMPQALLSDLLD